MTEPFTREEIERFNVGPDSSNIKRLASQLLGMMDGLGFDGVCDSLNSALLAQNRDSIHSFEGIDRSEVKGQDGVHPRVNTPAIEAGINTSPRAAQTGNSAGTTDSSCAASEHPCSARFESSAALQTLNTPAIEGDRLEAVSQAIKEQLPSFSVGRNVPDDIGNSAYAKMIADACAKAALAAADAQLVYLDYGCNDGPPPPPEERRKRFEQWKEHFAGFGIVPLEGAHTADQLKEVKEALEPFDDAHNRYERNEENPLRLISVADLLRVSKVLATINRMLGVKGYGNVLGVFSWALVGKELPRTLLCVSQCIQ